MSSFVEKYRPKNFKELKGQDLAIAKIKDFVKNFPKKKACILYGPAGCGKTSMAYALANEIQAEIIELNASDLRNKDSIANIAGNASKQCSLFKTGKLILMDEIDGISGFYDRGGIPELVGVIEDSCFPIIMTANKIWDKKFSTLRSKSEMVELKELNYKDIFEILKLVSEKEGRKLTEDMLKRIAINVKGDVRAGLNDIQSIPEGQESKEISSRDKEENIFNVLKQVFKGLPSAETLGLYDKLDMPLDEVYLWLEENLPKEYKGEELARAIDLMSRADVFRGRIIRQQHWRFLIYQNFFLSYGICASKKNAKTGFTSYKRPDRVLKIWMINQRNAIKKEIAKKIARYCHISTGRAMQEFDLLKNILQKNTKVHEELKLDEKEAEYLRA